MIDAKRQVFYSFHYKPDAWRVSQVRNIGSIEGNRPAPDNDWETIAKVGDGAIKKWINDQMKYRSCTIVLIGKNTAKRKWIDYEIIKSWGSGMGVAGIYIHGLRNQEGYITLKGSNPFAHLRHKKSGKKLSEMAHCYNPVGANSRERYDWISKNISAIVEEAIKIRNNY